MGELDEYQNADPSAYADGVPKENTAQDGSGGYFQAKNLDDVDALVDEIMALLDPENTKYNRVHEAHSGRFGTVAGGATEMHGLMGAIAATGGFSYRPGEHSPTKGMVLSVHPEASKIIDVKDLKPKDIKDYIAKNKDLLKDKNNYIGAWHDKESGKIFLDVSTIVPDHATAVKLSNQYGQRAYYDLSTGTEVTVMSGNDPRAHQTANAPGTQEQKAGKGKMDLHVLTSDATDEEITKMIEAIKKSQTAYDNTRAS